jgi:flagellar motor switch protein FliN/FliY
MSDGALSQDEIDALLSGGSSGGGDSGGSGGVSAGPSPESEAIQGCLVETVATQSRNLSTLTGADAEMTGPQCESTDRDTFIAELPDQVVAVTANFTGGFPGEHVFIMSEDCAKKVAALMNQEEHIELDDMAMSVLGEVFNQVVGTEITVLTQKTNNKTITTGSPQAASMAKAAVPLPAGNFVKATYGFSLGGENYSLWEVFGPQPSSAIEAALSPASQQASPGMGGMGGMSPAQNMGGMSGMGAMQGQMPGMGMGQMGGMQGMNPAMMNAMGMGQMGGGMGMNMGSPANVQAVQFPNLMPQATPQEQGNIGLIMDVFMEMTVELGRTRKLIKEILSMGEGTIIELDKLAGEPVDILVNHKLIAKGEVVVIDENFGVRVTEIVSPVERVNDLQ